MWPPGRAQSVPVQMWLLRACSRSVSSCDFSSLCALESLRPADDAVSVPRATGARKARVYSWNRGTRSSRRALLPSARPPAALRSTRCRFPFYRAALLCSALLYRLLSAYEQS